MPPSARECVGSLALGPTLMVFGGRGRTCRNDLALFSLKRESRAGDIPKEKANELGIICSVWLNPGVSTDDKLDHKALFEIHRKAMSQAIHKAMNNEPSIDWLLEHQDEITHKYYERGLKGEI